jgi:hypothetical protein
MLRGNMIWRRAQLDHRLEREEDFSGALRSGAVL